jgi:alkylation response protein AidB-like acyl-CoA dehydrogenase
MSSYQPETADTFFLLQALQAPQQLQALPPYPEVDAALMQQVLEEVGKFVASVVAPLNRDGDEIGCRFELKDGFGHVTTPPGFRDAYQAFWHAGWPALSAAPEHGGQGLPVLLEAILYEMLSAANHGWTMAPGLLHGAYECLAHHGSTELKARYLSKIASGEWLATMCLTEPQAGSDLGLIRTQAVPQADGSYALSGTKIFISGGEHDLTDNIVHLVLARLPDAPPGPKGLSLFLAPKHLPASRPLHEAASSLPAPLGECRGGGSQAENRPHPNLPPAGEGATPRRNPIYCERIEEKMGLHGSPTCVMRFDAATGWIVGEPGRGLAAMFVMMNAARLHVALQGLGLLNAAWQKADAYSKERRQMRAPGRGKSAVEADLIADHPAMCRILDTQRAWIDGGRLIAYRTALELDIAKHHTDPARREAAQRWCSLVTPVIKAAFTSQAFYGSSECLQVFGGHGYVRESGIEQHVRDARVAMIYEGTNEIQAIDLLQRKVLPDGAAALTTLLHELRQDLDASHAADAQALRLLAALGEASHALVAACAQDAKLAYWVADDYLRAVALALLAWAWARIDGGRRTAAASAAATIGNEDQAGQTPVPPPPDPRWEAPAQALRHWVLPEFDMRLQIALQRCRLEPTRS